jgi:hypothetical protein
MSTNGPLVHFAGSTIRFSTGNAELLKALDTHFKHCFGKRGEVLAEFEITTANEADFSLARDGEALFPSLDFEQVLWHLMQDGLTELNGASRTHLVFHAAALAQRDAGFVLFGKSGSGKSTLAAGLVAGGFQYLSDEVIALPAAGGGEITGFCRSLVLKRGSAFIWEPLLPQSSTEDLLLFKDGGAWITPTLLNAASVRLAVVPRLLVFARYEAGASLQAERLTSANSLFHLLRCLVNARNFPDHGMGPSAALARQVPAFSLTYSDLESAGEWIQDRIQAG